MVILKTPNEFKRVVTCEIAVDDYGHQWGQSEDYCGAELEITAGDIVYRQWYKDFGTVPDTDYGVVCPCCHSFITVKNLPKWIKDKATLYMR
jgi:hypothetical protein